MSRAFNGHTAGFASHAATLPGRAVEKMDVDNPFVRQDNEIATLKDGLDRVRGDLATIGLRIRELSVGQEALELQTALLSSEAEHGLPRTPPSAPSPDGAVAPIKALEQLRSRLNELAQTLEVSAEQTEDRIDTLESRLEQLQDTSRGLEEAVSELHTVIAASNRAEPDAGAPQDPVQAESAEASWRSLFDEVGALKTTEDAASDRMAALEKNFEGLQETLKSLNLQQVRTDHDVRALEQKSKRLSYLVTTGGVFAAAVLVWLLGRG